MTRNVRTIFLILAVSSLGAANAARAADTGKPAANASPAQAPLTVDDAVKLALERSSRIVGADASLVDARSGLYRSYSGILPFVQISGTRSASVREQLRGTQSF